MSQGLLQIIAQEARSLYKFSLALPELPPLSASRVVSASRWEQLHKAHAGLVPEAPFGRVNEEELRLAIGRLGSLLRALMPQEVLESLDLAGRDQLLQLKVQDCPLPWELLEVQSRSLARRVQLSRWLGAEALPPCPKAPRRALLVLNPEGLQPWSTGWHDGLGRALGQTWRVESLVGGHASVAGLREALSQTWGILHLHVYADYLESNPEQSKLYMADGPLTAEAFARRFPTVPSLAVLHLSLAGKAAPGCPGAPLAQHWGQAVSRLGVPTVLVNAWDVEPRDAMLFFQVFYDGLSRGQTVGKALLEARGESPQGLAWMALGDLGITGDQLTALQRQEQPTQEASYRASHCLAVRRGPRSGEEFPLMLEMLRLAGPLTLGGPGPQECDVELDDDTAPNPSAFLSLEGEQLVLLPAPGVHLLVNGLPVYGRSVLEVGWRIEIGNTMLEFAEVGAAGRSQAPGSGLGQYELRVENGPTMVIADPVFTVGRQGDCHLVLNDPAVSRRQLTIVLRDGDFYLSPVGSAQMFLNGVQVDRETRLSSGDVLRLGNHSTLRFARVEP